MHYHSVVQKRDFSESKDVSIPPRLDARILVFLQLLVLYWSSTIGSRLS